MARRIGTPANVSVSLHSNGRAIDVAKKQNHVFVIQAPKISWCRFCFKAHDNDEHAACENEALAVNDSEEFWTPDHVEAYRGFTIDPDDDGEIWLKGARHRWHQADPGPAQCLGAPKEAPQHDHDSPHALCTCGYHALKSRAALNFIFTVQAKVLMWGDIIEHEHGYRSERIEIVGLDYPHSALFGFQRREEKHHTMWRLRKKYKVGGIK